MDRPTRASDDNGNSPPILSVEELEALLRNPPEPAATPPVDESAHVLLISKNEEDLKLLSHLASTIGFEISVARNPFTGLDYLRARRYHVVFADFSAWTARGSLLFERIAKLDHAVEVVYICDRDPREFEAARSTPARHVLVRPMKAAEVAPIVEEVCRDRMLTTDSSSSSHPRQEANRPSHELPEQDPGRSIATFHESNDTESAPDVSTQAGPVAEPQTESADPGPATETSHELEDDHCWRQFFTNARRDLPQCQSVSERWQRLFDLLLAARGGGAVALLRVSRKEETPPTVSIAAVKAGLSKKSKHTNEDAKLGKKKLQSKLQQILQDLRERLRSDEITWTNTGEGILCLPHPDEKAPRLVLVSIPLDEEAAETLPESMREEFSSLLRDVEHGDDRSAG